jgi:uncharacterized protein (DUF1697 family)
MSAPVHRYVALLRGINVGTANRISMTDLRSVFEALRYTDVTTLLQSGNVVFTAPRGLGPSATIALEDELANTTGVQARILVLDAARFLEVARANPLVPIADNDSLLVVTFLGAAPPASLEVPTDLEPEVLEVGDKAIYQWCPRGVSKSIVPPKFFRSLGPEATTRNWRTVKKIAGLLGETV